jgi:hypothetical protein
MSIAALCTGLLRYHCMFPVIIFIVSPIEAIPNSENAVQELAE